MSQVIGVDIGGTFIKAGVVSNGKVLKDIQVPARADKGHQAFLESINHAIYQLSKGRRIRAIGVGSAGAIDIKRGIVINSPNTPQRNFPLRDHLRSVHGVKVMVDNDAHCFTLAEALMGAGKDYGIVAGITLGTGVGGGLVINKKLYHGRGRAGEFGHITMDFHGWEGPTGLRGGVEEYVGSRGVMRLGRKLTVISPKHLAEMAKTSSDAKIAWEEFGKLLGIALANITYAVDPDIIVVGGQIAKAWPYFHKAAKASLEEACFFPPPPIARASTMHAGILGAALLCK